MMGLQSVGQRNWSAAAAVGFCSLDQGRADRPVGMATIRFLRQQVDWAQEEAAVDTVVFHRSRRQRTLSCDVTLTQTEQWLGKEWKATAVMAFVAA